MGLLSKLKSNSSSNSDTASTMTENSTNPLNPSADDTPRKKSLYEKYQDRKRGPGTSNLTDEELMKYTGKTREEFDTFSKTAPGVAGGQAAGSITAGGNSGIGTMAGAGEGLGGWGTEAGKVPNRDEDRVIR